MKPVPPPWFPAPTMADLRDQLTREVPLGTGWPALDSMLGGLRRGEIYAVEGPPSSRRRVLARLAAWAGGDGHRVVWVGNTQAAPRMKLQVLAAGVGCTAAELEETTDLDDLLDEAIRRIHVVTVGAGSDPEHWLQDFLSTGAPFDVLIVDDFTRGDEAWVKALGGAVDVFWSEPWGAVLRLAARRRAVIVLAGTSMPRAEMAAHVQLGRYRSDTRCLGVAVDSPELQATTKMPLGVGAEAEVGGEPVDTQQRPPAAPSQCRNVWEELCERRLLSFAAALGATPVE